MGQTASGTLIGAVLESAGYHYQSHILDVLGNPLANGIGGLVYLVGIVITIFYIAIKGKYDLSPWLLLGPAMYFVVLFNRESIPNAQWRFGAAPINQASIDQEVQKLNEGQTFAGGAAKVSALFSFFTQMINTASQEIIRTINDGKKDVNFGFILKSELFSRMHIDLAKDPGFQRLIQKALLSDCGRLTDLSRAAIDLSNPNVNTATPKKAEGDAYFKPNAQEARAQFQKEFEQRVINPDPEVAEYIAALELGDGAADFKRLKERQQIIRNTGYSCRDVWEAAYAGLLTRGRRQLKSLVAEGENHQLESTKLLNFMARANGLTGERLAQDGSALGVSSPETLEQLTRIIAFYLLRNEMNRPSAARWLSEMSDRPDFREVKAKPQGHDFLTEQARVSIREWSERTRLISAASNLPYYSGLVLFFLGATFPFFALLLLIPGKHAGFLLWFVMWVWVKFWDVGFAIVMLLDDIFFAMFSQSAAKDVDKNLQILSPDFDLAFKALKEMDPTFQLATYYNLIGVCVMAIPVVSAQLLMGSLQGGAGLIAQGVDRFSGFFADSSLSRSSQTALNNVRHMTRDMAAENATNYAQNDFQGNDRYSGKSSPLNLFRLTQKGSDGQTRSGYGARTSVSEGIHQVGRDARDLGLLQGFAGSIGKQGGMTNNILDVGARGYNANKSAGAPSFAQGMATRVPSKGALIFSTVAKGVGGASDGLLGTIISNKMTIAKSELTSSQTWGTWDSDTSAKVRTMVQNLRIYGGFELPPIGMAAELPFSKEIDVHKARFGAKIELNKAAIEAGGKLLTTITDRNVVRGGTPEAMKANGFPGGNNWVPLGMLPTIAGGIIVANKITKPKETFSPFPNFDSPLSFKPKGRERDPKFYQDRYLDSIKSITGKKE